MSQDSNRETKLSCTDTAGNTGSKDSIKSHDVSIMGIKEEVKCPPYDSLKGLVKLQTEIKTHSFWVRRGEQS